MGKVFPLFWYWSTSLIKCFATLYLIITRAPHSRCQCSAAGAVLKKNKKCLFDLWPWRMTLTFHHSKCAAPWDTHACQISSCYLEYCKSYGICWGLGTMRTADVRRLTTSWLWQYLGFSPKTAELKIIFSIVLLLFINIFCKSRCFVAWFNFCILLY